MLQALEAQAKEIPEALSSVLLNYKALKKKIKAIPAADGEGGCQSEAEADFVRTLNADVEKFNELFMDKEEIAVMKLASLAEDVQRLKKSLEAEKGNTISLSSRASALMRSLVDFHGDLVLTLHWSLINYSALSKILKKHDKRTGVQIRQPYLTSILQQVSLILRKTGPSSHSLSTSSAAFQQHVHPEQTGQKSRDSGGGGGGARS